MGTMIDKLYDDAEKRMMERYLDAIEKIREELKTAKQNTLIIIKG